ncbi:hypothetical protein AB4Y87_10470 [Paenarthrobacter sp. RAF54_2]|uniref:hypothetical protein n=1 Tax=Paenarthrobacter sp. RAF54_2 TaxID=3233061 RepID=UPI003F96157F
MHLLGLRKPGAGAEGIVVNEPSDLERVASWTEEPAQSRRFLLLDVPVSPHVIEPHQREIICLHS